MNELLADVRTGISDLEFVFGFHIITCGDVCSDPLELHGFNSCGQGVEEDAVGFAKTFPDVPRVSQMLGGLFLRLGIPRDWLRSPPGSG